MTVWQSITLGNLSSHQRHIRVLIDHCTKYVQVIPVPDQTAETCAAAIVYEFVARWGCPLSIHSALGRGFESNVFKEMCKKLIFKFQI